MFEGRAGICHFTFLIDTTQFCPFLNHSASILPLYLGNKIMEAITRAIWLHAMISRSEKCISGSLLGERLQCKSSWVGGSLVGS